MIVALFRTETNLLDSFFAKDSDIQRDFSYVDTHHGGTGTFDLVLGREESLNFKSIKTYNSILALIKGLETTEGVKRVESYAMPVRMVHGKMAGREPSSLDPHDSPSLAQELLFLEFSKSESREDVLTPFLNFDATVGRLVVRTNNLSNLEAEQTKRALGQTLANFPHKVELSGNNEYFLHLAHLLLETQLRSILMVLVAIFLLTLLFYSLKASLTAIFVNVIPATTVMLLIVVADIPFDFSTVLITSICLGIAVDDSIHLIHHLDRGKGPLRDRFLVGLAPVVAITAIFTGVFLLFATSPIVLFGRFGPLSAMMMVLSLLSTLFFVPSFYPSRAQSMGPRPTDSR